MTGQTTDLQWYIARDGKQHGPLTDIEMRTFVAHSYLRATDLIWRPGMAEWQAAPIVFPAVFAPPAPAPQPEPAPALTPQPQSYVEVQQSAPSPAAISTDFEPAHSGAGTQRGGGIVKRIAIAASVVSLVGGGAFALATYREPLMKIVAGGPAPVQEPAVETVRAPESAPVSEPASVAAQNQDAATEPAPVAPATPTEPVTTANDAAPPGDANKETQVAAIDPKPAEPPAPVSIDGSPIDVRLQKVPAWAAIKRDFPDWYTGEVTAAEKLVADNKSETELAQHLAQGLMSLRRQNAEKALQASPEKIRRVATTFLDHIKSLRAKSVSACYGFISKGEVSPAVVEALQNPETAVAFNAQEAAIFEAIADGTKSPVKHDPAVKSDYEMLIKELNKLGWKEDDLQTFSNPRLLSKREPDQVCKMVQEWFTAHLAVQDKAAQNRLLFETLKPVVSG